MKIAVVGGGPAAAAVLAAITEEQPEAEVTVFDIAQEPKPLVAPPPFENPNDRAYLVRLYRELRKSHGYSFPPPKSHFGYIPGKAKVDQKERVWASAVQGGLSQIWGASVLPFTDNELANWPISAEDLAPYYQAVAEMIGISGDDDGLSNYFDHVDLNRPPTKLAEPFAKLSNALNGKSTISGARIVAGIARLALETRDEQSNNCIFCGGCMTGCSRGSVYCAATDIDRFKAIGTVDHHIDAKVLSFDPVQKIIQYRREGRVKKSAQFDHIYLSSGCLSTSEIVMRSFGLADGPIMLDNSVITFPLISLRPGSVNAEGTHVLTSLVAALLPHDSNAPITQIQFYPTFDLLWRYYLPHQIWPLADWFGGFLKQRLFWGRLYLSGDKSAKYSLHLGDHDKLKLKLQDNGGAKKDVQLVLKDLKSALVGSGFAIPPIGSITHGTSSHYAATFPYGGENLDVPSSGEIAPGVYICDSSVFCDSPSVSPTLTIMANAWRTAAKSLQ